MTQLHNLARRLLESLSLKGYVWIDWFCCNVIVSPVYIFQSLLRTVYFLNRKEISINREELSLGTMKSVKSQLLTATTWIIMFTSISSLIFFILDNVLSPGQIVFSVNSIEKSIIFREIVFSVKYLIWSCSIEIARSYYSIIDLLCTQFDRNTNNKIILGCIQFRNESIYGQISAFSFICEMMNNSVHQSL